MAKIENLDTLSELTVLYKKLLRVKREEMLRVEIKLPSGTVTLPKDMLGDIRLLCLKKLSDVTKQIENL